jgi:hypothetical protein
MGEIRVASIAEQRLANHRLVSPSLGGPAESVQWLVGIQAQDDSGARWSIGLRLPGSTAANIDKAIRSRQIIRTWAMRGTLHLVAAQDIGWLLSLLSPMVISANARRYRQLELDEATFAVSNNTIATALRDGAQLTRKELVEVLARDGVSAERQRAPYLLQRAALDGLICFGPKRGREPTYISLRNQLTTAERLERPEALATLARRYFASHGPATQADFAWWSGLSAREARFAIDAVGHTLVQETTNQQTYSMTAEPAGGPRSKPVVHLLPAFDNYLLGYKERDTVLDPTYRKRVNAGGGIPKPSLLLNGRVAGVWKRRVSKGATSISVDPFRTFNGDDERALAEAVEQLEAFLTTPVARADPI